VLESVAKLDEAYYQKLGQGLGPPRLTWPPVVISKHVLKFCTRFGKQQPQFVAVEPVAGALLHECIMNVRNHVEKHGGQLVNGWTIWEWPTILLEAEFHTCWLNSEGRLIDITPKRDGEKRMCFVQDKSIEYKELRIPNKQMPLRKNLPELDAFIAAAKAKYRIMGADLGLYEATSEFFDNERCLHDAIVALHKRTPMNLFREARIAVGLEGQ